MSINIRQNTLNTNGLSVNLDSYRLYIITNYPDLCKNLFIKKILMCSSIGLVSKFTYDWDEIFKLAEESGYLKQFIAKIKYNHLVISNDYIDEFGNEFKKGDLILA